MLKKIFFVIFFTMLCACSTNKISLVQDNLLISKSNIIAYGEVTCCCNTYNGICCKEMSFCSGYIPGCICN